MNRSVFFRVIFFCLAVSLLITGCNSWESEDVKFRQDEDGDWILFDIERISKSKFDQMVVGYGWKHVESHEIGEDGKCIEKEFYEGSVGGAPSKYFFAQDTLTSFFSYLGLYSCYKEKGFSYREEDNHVILEENYPELQIVNVDNRFLYVIESYGSKFLYTIYEKMTEEELMECRDVYSKNIDHTRESVHFKKDENGEWFLPDVTTISKEKFNEKIAGNGWDYMCTYKIESDGTCAIGKYYNGMVGKSPSFYYFDKECMTTFFFYDAIPATCYRIQSYSYEENDNCIIKVGNSPTFMRIIYINDYFFEAIEYLGYNDREGHIYGYSIYQKMFPGRLEEVREKYSTNFDDL